MQLDIVERDDNISQVALIGRLDLHSLNDINLKFHAATAVRSQPAVIDLSQLTYIASLGMGMLISCAQSLHRKGHTMVLYGATGDVETALKTAGLDQAIPLVANLDAAIVTLQSV